MVASVLSLDITLEHALLAVQTRAEALRLIHAYLSHEVQILEIRGKIASQAQNEMGKEQREYFLRQQLRAIQQELSGKEGESELELLRERLKAADLPEDVRKEADREMRGSTVSPRRLPITTSGGPGSNSSSNCRGPKAAIPRSIFPPPGKFSRTTTTA